MKNAEYLKKIYPQNSKRMIDVNLGIEYSPYKVLAHQKLLKEYVDGKKIHPIHARIGLTNRCNLRCHFCNFHSENEKDFYDNFNYKDEISYEDIQVFLKEFAENGGKAVTFCGSGECTIHSNYVDICYFAKDVGLEIGLITNGIRLEDKAVINCVAKTHSWVRIGLNAGSGKTYQSVTGYEGKKYYDILNSIQYLREYSQIPDFRVGANFVITMRNYFDIKQAAIDVRGANANYLRFEPEFYSALAHETIYGRIDEINERLKEAKSEETEEYKIFIPKLDRGAMTGTDKTEGEFEKCHYCNFVTALGADGYMYPCPQVHLNNDYRMGNAISHGYKNWIKSNEKEEWLTTHINRKAYCKTCFYRAQNELIEWLINENVDVEEICSILKQDKESILHENFV